MKKEIKYEKWFLVIFLAFILIFSIKTLVKESYNQDKYTLTIGNKRVDVEVSDTIQERRWGLMYKKEMPTNEGMIFIYETEGSHSIWMKNTFIPLDIIWVNADKKIVDVESYVPPCKQDPCKSYTSRLPSKYIIEVNGDWASENNVKIGDTVEFHNFIR